MPVVAAESLPNTVLVVDDEPIILSMLSSTLKRVGLEHRCVASGEEALEAMKEARWGAVVTDKNLPGLGGLDVIRHAREHQPYCAAILITAYVNTESVLEALRMGANDYILKPFSNVMLVAQRVKQAIDHQRVAFERAALAEALRGYEARVRQSETEAFRHRTELDLFQSVMDVRLQDATGPLQARIGALEEALRAEQQRAAQVQQAVTEVARALRQPLGNESPSMFPAPGREELAARLEEEATRLAKPLP